MKAIIHNRLDYLMEHYSGMTVTPETFLKYFDYKPAESERYLRNWMSREAHKNDFFTISEKPLAIKITLTPHDTKVSNANMMSKKRKRSRRWI